MDARNVKKGKKAVFSNITKYALLSTIDSANTPIIHLRFEMAVASDEFVNNFVEFVLNSVKIKGIFGIGKQNKIVK